MSGELRSWWLSWYQPAGTAYTLYWPWWVSGWRMDDDARTVVAAVRAATKGDAMAVVVTAQDDPTLDLEWRFVEEVTDSYWSPYNSRFLQADWMRWPDEAPRDWIGGVPDAYRGEGCLPGRVVTGDARADFDADFRLRANLMAARRLGQATFRVLTADLAILFAEHNRLAAADPVAVVAGVDLEGVLAGHQHDDAWGCCCGWQGPEDDEHAPAFAGHQAEQIRAALTEALGGGA